MSTDRNPLSDKELWQRFAAAPSGTPGTVSEIDFAAWLEGRLSEGQAARVEAAVAADPELRRSALELSDILGQMRHGPLPAAPPRLAVRAQALVGYDYGREGAERDIRGGSWFSRLLSSTATFGVPRAAMATAALLVAVTGFMMGGGLGESYAQQRYGIASTEASDTTNELSAFFATDGL